MPAQFPERARWLTPSEEKVSVALSSGKTSSSWVYKYTTNAPE
jgi:hypothetical protein